MLSDNYITRRTMNVPYIGSDMQDADPNEVKRQASVALEQKHQTGVPGIAGPNMAAMARPVTLPGVNVPDNTQPAVASSPVTIGSTNAPGRIGPPGVTMPDPAPPSMGSLGLGSSVNSSDLAQAIRPQMPNVKHDPTQFEQDQQKQTDLNKGDGIHQFSQKHHIAGPILRALNVIGSVAAPNVAQFVPGTSLHHRLLVNENNNDLKRDTQQAHQQAETAHLNQETADAGKPKVGGTPDEVTLHDLMAGDNGNPRVNPDTGKPYSYLEAYGAVKQAAADTKTPTVPEGEKPLGDKVTQANKMLEQRWQIRHPNQPLSPTYTLPPNATQKDYDRIDKALEAEERANGTKAQQDTANEMRRQTFDLMRQGASDRHDAAQAKTKEALAKKLQPMQDTLDEIAESREYAASPSATNDYGLLMNFIGVTKPESLAKLRLNQNEVKLAQGTRGLLGDLEATKQKLSNGETLTPDQRKSILDTMGIVEKYAHRRIGNMSSNAQPADDQQQGAGATPQTHTFSVSAWKQANPHGDVNAAKTAAQKQNYQVVP